MSRNKAKRIFAMLMVFIMAVIFIPQLPGTDSTAFATPTRGLFLGTSNMSGDGYEYNGSTHVLNLNGYTGSANNLYFTGVSETKNQIILSGSNSINLTSQTGTGNIEGIYSGSELRIAGDGKLLIQINANMLYNQGLTGIFANKKLTITESAQVTIIINSTSVDKGNTTYGIKAMGGISVESGASLDIRIEDCGKSYPVYGIYNYGGEIHISGNQKKSIEIAGGSSGYGIYNYSYSTAEGNGNIRISGGSNAEASVNITMHDGADNFHVGIMSDKGSNKLNNTTGVISISSKTVNISGTERGIVNASAARNTADIAINDSKLTINGTENGIISYQNGASFDNSVVNITASGIAADFSDHDGFKNRSDYGLCISGGSKVNLISESTTAVRTYSTSDTGAVSTIDLKNGGLVEVTAANNDAGNNMNAWKGFVKLGSTTDFEKGSRAGDSHSLDSDARGCASIPSGSTTILKLKYSPAYPEGSDIQVNNGTFSFGESVYYKNGDTAESHTGSGTDYNAYYNSETGVLELKGYEGGYINISSATPREITIRLTGENIITADTIFGGSGNIYYGINMRDMKKINFTGDGTLNVNVNAPGSSAAAGIFIGKSGASVTNAQLNFKDTAKVKIDVSEKNDGSSNSYNVSAIDASAMANGFAVTIDEGAELDMNITSPYATTYGIYLPTDEKAAAAINGGFHLKMKCNGTSGSATSFKSFSTSKGTFTIGEKASVSVEMPSGVNHDMENFKVEAAGSNLVSSLLSGSYVVASYETEDFRMIKSDPDAGYIRYGSFDYMSKAGATGVSGVSVTSDNDSLSNGDTATASATVSPATATYPGVTWSSGNKDLAAVDKDGKITAASSGSGKVAITATSKFNRLKSGSTAVTVGTLDDNKIYEITGITVAQPVVGAQPATAESVTVAEGFTISAVSWSYSPDGGKSWAELSSSDVFEAGKEYRVKLDISKTTEGKTYADKGQTVAWVNGEAVQAGDISSDGTIAYFTYNLGQPSASITKQPESQTVSCYTSEPVTLSCEVTLPEGQTAEYQWYMYDNNAWMPAWIAGDGDQTSTLTITNRSFESLQFYCKITVKEGDTEVETLQTNSARIKLVHSENDVSYNNTGSSSKHKKNCGYCGGSLDEAHTIINIVTREATSSLNGTYNKVCTKCGYTSEGHTYAYVNGGTVAIYLEGLPGGTQARNIKALKSGTVEDTSNPPTKAGYTFLGWSLTEGASIPDINAGQSILFTGDTEYYEKNHFYAVWELSASGTVTTLDVDNTSQSGTNWSWTVNASDKTANLTLDGYSGGGFSIDGTDNSSNKYDITVTMIGDNEMAVTKDSTGWLYGINVLTVSGNTESTANSLTFKDGGNGTGTLSIRGRLSESGTQYAVQAEKIPSLTVESGTLNIDMGAMIGSQTLYGIYCSGYGDNSSTDGMFTLGENAVLNISGDMAGWSGGKFYGIRTNNGDIYGKLNIEADGTKSFIAAGIDAANGASRIVNFNGKEDVIISLPQSGNSR
ncbi:MAG: Ig-like domain-containing protein, partial [Bacillota bacterium]|nr:Ig-like domain-containing protein [Bacillota bacterium]